VKIEFCCLIAELGRRPQKQQSVFCVLQPRHGCGGGANQQKRLRAWRDYFCGRRGFKHEQRPRHRHHCKTHPGNSNEIKLLTTKQQP